jgi:uncharacterized protein
MRPKYLFILVAVVSLLAGMFVARALGQTAEQTVAQRPTGFVQDRAGVFSAGDVAALEQKLEAYEKASTNEVGVLVVPNMGGEDVEGYSNRVFHEWGIGKKDKKNGVLLVVSIADRKLRIEVGYGLEGVLPDGRAGQIIRESIVPAFKQQHYSAGILSGVDAILAQLNTDPPAPTKPSDQSGVLWIFAIGGLVILVIGGIVWFMSHEEEPESYVPEPYVPAPYVPIDPLNAALAGAVIGSTIRRHEEPREEEHHEEERSRSSYRSDDNDRSSSSSSSDSSSSFGGFGGGDSGGGGASGSW